MHYNLKPVRESYGMSVEEFAALIGRSPVRYEAYEAENEIPCKFIYMLWKKLPNFPIPDDFFHYTSFALNINMRYHKLKQEDIAKMFGMRQATVSTYFLSKPIPMYELKGKFDKCFNPMIIPCIVCKTDEKGSGIKEITELECRGDFVANRKKVRSLKKRARKKDTLPTTPTAAARA